MTTKKQHSRNIYHKEAAEEYVKFLGLWSFPNPFTASLDKRKRSDAEYRALLNQLIEVNKTRKDDIGAWETKAARRELVLLGGKV